MPDTVKKIFQQLYRMPQAGSLGTWIFHATIIGIVAGLASLGFNWTLEQISHHTLEGIGGYSEPLPRGEQALAHGAQDEDGGIRPLDREKELAIEDPIQDDTLPEGTGWSSWSWSRLWLLVIPALGGLLTGLLVFTFAPEAEGHGTDAVIDAIHRKRGFIALRVPIVKIIASSLTIGTGGSAGREGPIAQVAAGFASYIARLFKLSPRQTRILVAAGVGSGVGSMFRAPLGGAVFAVDVMYGEPEFEYEALLPAMIASIVGYTVTSSLSNQGWGAIFDSGNLQYHEPAHLLVYALLAAVLAVMGVVYLKVFDGTKEKFFDRIHIPRQFKPMLGGLLVGLMAMFFPQVLGVGYGFIQMAMDGDMTIRFMLTLALTKILATSLTICSGGSGGVFAPSLVIGAMIGGVFGEVVQYLFPDLGVDPSAFVLVGMAGFFAGVAKVPFSVLLMVCEMTMGYQLLAPLMLTVALTYVLLPLSITIYKNQVASRADSPAHVADFAIDVLESIQVSDILGPHRVVATIGRDTTLPQILELVADSEQHAYPVTDQGDVIVGMLNLDDVRSALVDQSPGLLVVAHDLTTTRFNPVLWEDDLSTVLHKLLESDCEELPVLGAVPDRKLCGLIGMADIVAAYDRGMRSLKHDENA